MSHKRKVLQGSASNLVRVLLSMLVSLVLPPFLVSRMAPAEYGAWVLILQLSAYVNLLDLGLQTAIGKLVAEYDASGDHDASHRLVSTSFTILAVAASIASAVIVAMVWSVPRLFHQMPPALVPQVRIALLTVGLSTAASLPFGTFLATFTGLQQYFFPTLVATVSRVGSAAVLIVLLLLHANLVQLALVIAAFTLGSAIAQLLGWRRYLKQRVSFSLLLFDRRSAAKLARYCSVFSVWLVAMFFVSGVDVIIVGHYRYKETGFYWIASAATNFMVALISSVFGPLIPAISSIQSGTTPNRIGALCIKATRYCGLLLCLLGLPLVFGGYPLLSLWVGKGYAARSTIYLEVLVLGNIVRQLFFPYILVVVATGKQHLATFAAIAEACVNIVLSIWLVQRIGAVGVAVGTLAGAFVSVGVHLFVSIPLTRGAIHMERSRLLLQGLLRPLLSILPSLLLFPFWKRLDMLPAQPAILATWVALTALIAWQVVLTSDDRSEFQSFVRRLLYWRQERT